jgi:hypothetical protein
MSDPSLPPGTTHADIDEAFGAPERRIAQGDVTIAVDVDVPADMDDDEIEAAMIDAVRDRLQFDETVPEIVDVEIGEVLR